MTWPKGRQALAMSMTALAIVVALAVLGLVSDDAEAGGSGDWPPPSSGTWYINQATSVWSETLTLGQSIYVYSSLQMNFVNLTFDCTSDGQYIFYVTSSGSLSFVNGNVTAKDKSYHYRFLAYGSTTIRNSDLSEAIYGLEIHTKSFTLTNSDVFDMASYGVYMSLPYTLKGKVLIDGNTFINNDNYGLYIYQYASVNRVDYPIVMTGDVTIKKNRFEANLGGGLYIYRYMYAYWSMEETMLMNLTIEGNEMLDNRGYSLYVYTYLYSYQGAEHGTIVHKGAINVNNNTIRDNSGYATVYYYNHISIYYGADAKIDSDINMVGNTITGNKDTYTVYVRNSIYEYYGRDAKVRIDLRAEANNVSDNGGHAFYVYSYSNTDRGDVGICTNDGDVVFRDNTIQDNLGSGVYIYRTAYASYSAYCSITGDITFEDNHIRNNQGYGGVYIYSYAQKNRGDPNASARVRGDVRFINNTFENNLGYGAYVYAYARSYYGSDADVLGDVLFKGNVLTNNAGYAGYIVYDAYKQEGAESGHARVVSNATFESNTLRKNSGAHGFYYLRQASSYSSSYSIINGTVAVDGNIVEDNKGYGFYIYIYSYNSLGILGNTNITGDIWVRDNVIRRNAGGGVYLYCYASSSRAMAADIYQNVTFEGNTVTDNGYSGLSISLGVSSDRATSGDTHIIGRINCLDNDVSYNKYYGIYLYRYATASYTTGTDVVMDGDVRLEGNTLNGNVYYAALLYHYIYNTQAGLDGRALLKADYIVRNNTVTGNLYYYTMYLYRYVYAYYTGSAVLDSDIIVEDNTISSNRGIGVLAYDYAYQFYYGGSGVPDRGSFTQRGRMEFMRNTVTNNAGTGIHINSTFNAEVRIIDAAPVVAYNTISYNYGSYGLYCDLRDVTKPIAVRDNDMEHNTVTDVVHLSNSGTAPDVLLKDNRIRYNTVSDTTVAMTIGRGDFNATIQGNNVSYNDAVERVLYIISTGRIRVDDNDLIGNINATETLIVTGAANTSVINIEKNEVRGNAGNGIVVYTLGTLYLDDNTVTYNGGHGIKATTDITLEKPVARLYVRRNIASRNGGNGIWAQAINVLEVKDNTITHNSLAGLRVNAMKVMPALDDNLIEFNKVGLVVAGDDLAPITQTYTFTDLVVKDNYQEGLYVEDLTVQLRSCQITGSGTADIAVRRARVDCYATTVGYLKGSVYEKGEIHVWWRIDIDVQWQSGVPVPGARVVMANATGKPYREFETDLNGHIPHFNAEEWSMIDLVVNPWSPYAFTASKETESTTVLEKVDRSRNILIILVDAHVPVVTITQPNEGLLLNRTVVTVSATARDGGSGLKAVRVRVDGGPWTELGPVPSFTRQVDVPDGTHAIVVQAEDVAGMLGNATVNVTVDTEPPRLVLLSPVEGALTNSSTIAVEGRVLEPDLEVTVNGVPQTIDDDNGFRETVRLYEGPNVIRVLARDLAGNVRLLMANVTLDTVPPALFIDSPADRFLTRVPLVTVIGRSEPGATVSSMGSTVDTDPKGAFKLEVELVEGENLLAVSARDPAGNTATVTLRIRLDTVRPHLTIEEPPEGLLTKSDRLRVTGEVEMEEGLVLSVGGVFALPVGGRYNSTVDLVEGTNLIVVTARDRAGNEAQVNRTVVRRTIAPMLKIVRPPRDYLPTNEASYRLEGETAPDVALTVDGVAREVRSDGTFSAVVALKGGENAIVVQARDALGNEAKEVVHLILDTEPPELVLESPYSGVTYDEAVNVTGRTDVGANLTVNGIDVAVDGRGRFSYKIHLHMGDQNITVVSTDSAGNAAEATVQVTRLSIEEPPEPPSPPPRATGTGAAAIILVAIIVAVAAGGYVYIRHRRGK